MISPEVRKKYKVTIGIECHVQLKTKSKLFSSVGNDARDAEPNTLVSHIDFGLPGGLPVLNEEAVRMASRMAFALNTAPQKYSYFERKHYFYPDLPMGYQISQLHGPIVVGGEVVIEVGGEAKKIRINRVQIEADAGKNTHPAGKDYSLVDLNRAATPLLEIVSEPDISSPAEAKAYVRELYLLAKYADVSDADLYYGNMRFDVNVSVSATDQLGTRTETKNLNSFRAVEKAAEFEINRQIELLEKGEKIIQETRGWDDAKQKTTSQRGKEEAHDYRYMPDPDLPPVTLDDAYIEKIKSEMPVMPAEWRQRLQSLGLDISKAEVLLQENAESSLRYLDVISAIAAKDKEAALSAGNYLINRDISSRLKFREEHKDIGANLIGKIPTEQQFLDSFKMYKEGKLNSNKYDELLWELSINQNEDEKAEKYANERGLVQVSDENEIAKIVEEVLKENAKAAEDVKNGEMKAIGFLVGQVMKQSLGKANPQLAQELIKKQLGI